MSQNVPLQSIESHDLSVDKIMQDFYAVPTYQREYVWTEREVEQLLQDILAEYPDLKAPAAEYFVGSIVVCPGIDGMLNLIDGQQRMTTFFLITCAVRDRLMELGVMPPQIITSRISFESMDDLGHAVRRYRIKLQYSDSADVLDRIGAGEAIDPESLPNTRSAQRLLNAYTNIRQFLAQEFKEEPSEVQRFFAYIINHVKLVRIQTQSEAHALKVFETVNDRGVGLSPMDLLKNLMFIHASQADYDKLKDKWKSMVDTLHRAQEKPLRFLRYFIFAKYDVDRLREEGIYRWFTDHEKAVGFSADPLKFVDQLCDAATAYANFAVGKNPDGSPNRYLSNITALSYAARQHYILLLSAMHLPTGAFTKLCCEIENLFFAYIITREPTKEFERKFAAWASDLTQCRNEPDVDQYVQRYFDPAKQQLSDRFDLALHSLTEASVPRYRMRYILGKLAQYVEERAYGESEANLSLFLNERDLEHILPQTDGPDILFDKPEEYSTYVGRLGNLTILEESLNRSVSNKPFSDKFLVYSKSKFLLSKTIGAIMTIGDTKIDKAIKSAGLITFDRWDSAAIERRQSMLASLARQVWDIPSPNGPA
ncbi:DUF262 domain-containing protein [bacterium]|nr:DUF262 domain-containing protein [Chloroflexi bacterium CFX6]RIL11949.1 MAG: DUF262 domain-containing protein [bacterium]